jgi:hypothetical protein
MDHGSISFFEGDNPYCISLCLPQKETWGNVPPWRTHVPQVWGAQGTHPLPLKTCPHVTLLIYGWHTSQTEKKLQCTLLSHKLALIEIKSESSSVIQCKQEGGHCHLTNPLSLQAKYSQVQGGLLGLRLLGLGEMKLKVM